MPAAVAAGAMVYPRVCGGTEALDCSDAEPPGLSPRVRGNLARGSEAEISLGSIPACAGEPLPAAHAANPRPVYPRVCGGTARRRRLHQRADGLSPRVRGNPVQVDRAATSLRSSRKRP